MSPMEVVGGWMVSADLRIIESVVAVTEEGGCAVFHKAWLGQRPVRSHWYQFRAVAADDLIHGFNDPYVAVLLGAADPKLGVGGTVASN